MVSAVSTNSRKRQVTTTIFAPKKRQRTKNLKTTSMMVSVAVERPRRSRRSELEVSIIAERVRTLRKHGFNFLAISRILQCDNSWLHRLKDRYKIG